MSSPKISFILLNFYCGLLGVELTEARRKKISKIETYDLIGEIQNETDRVRYIAVRLSIENSVSLNDNIIHQLSLIGSNAMGKIISGDLGENVVNGVISTMGDLSLSVMENMYLVSNSLDVLVYNIKSLYPNFFTGRKDKYISVT